MPKGIRLLTKDEQESLLEDISNGKAVATWCREHDTQNSKVYVTLREDNSFLQSYSHARENQADSFVEKIFDVCHKLELREIDPHSARVIIDTLKWSAGKLKPKAWGDNQVLTVNVNGKLSMIDYLIKQQTAIEGDYTEHTDSEQANTERLSTSEDEDIPTPVSTEPLETPPPPI